MDQDHEIVCSFCLSSSIKDFNDLFKKNEENLSYFDKILASLSQLSDILNENATHNFPLCLKCCDTIDMIFNFHQNSLKNVQTFLNRLESIKIKKEIVENNYAFDLLDKSFEEKNLNEIFIKEEPLDNNSDENDGFLSEVLEVQIREGGVEMDSQCDTVLGKSLSQSERLLQGEKYNCAECSKIFNFKSNLTQHYRAVHLRIKPHQCNLCDKSFSSKQQLKTHIWTHTGRKKKGFKCDICGKSFSMKQNLKTHMVLHINAKLYTCSICGKVFPQSSVCKAHEQSHLSN